MRASVIIVSHNSRKDLEICLSSLIPTIQVQDELIVVDNASADGSAAFIAQNYPDVRLICNRKNLGFGWGCNLGASNAHGEYLVFLNPDTRVTPDWLDPLVDVLASDPEVGLVTPKILLLSNPQCVNTCGNEIHISGLTLCRGIGLPHTAFPLREDVNAVSGAAFAIRKDLFISLGGFDEKFFMYMEDTDLSMRARLAGYRIIYTPDSVVYHDYTLAFGPHKTFYQERNRYLMLLKNFRWQTLLALLPALLLVEVITWGFVLLIERRNLLNKIKAYAWLAAHWREIILARCKTQALRKAHDRELIASFGCLLAYEQTVSSDLTCLTHMVFDPIFMGLKHIAGALVRG